MKKNKTKRINRLMCALCLFILIFFPVQGQVNEGVAQVDDPTFQLLQDLSRSSLKNGSIYLFTTTHQDIAWLDHPEACIINRDTLWLTPFLDRLQNEPDFKMDIEQTSIVMEYIKRHPEKKVLINKYLKEGRICIGATYIQPYEEMYAGESLARQFYLGTRWLKKNFDGYNALSYFNVDVPGRTLQMPQIMRRAGVDNLIISRHERGLFRWESPDGSGVRTYTPGHYIYFYNVLGKNDTAAIKEVAQESVLWYTRYNNVRNTPVVMPAMLNYEFMWDQKPVENCVPFITKWNSIQYIQSDSRKKTKVNLPKFRYATADDFFNAMDQSTTNLPVVRGERPNVWLYIHGPSHEHAITASREGDILLPAAEKLASFNALAEESFIRYPEKRLNEAWESKIYPDHGWGGKNGIITDNTFQRKYEYALTEAKAIHDESMLSLASQIQTNASAGIPVVVFNTLSWERKDPVAVPVLLKKGYAASLSVKDAFGKPIPCQLSNVCKHDDGSILSADLHFVASAVPALGFATYYLNPTSSTIPETITEGNNIIENAYYRIELSKGGIRQIEDKELNVKLFDTSKFLAGEVITMQSVGNGAGEFDAVQQPTMDGFDKISAHQPEWRIKESGDVYTSYAYRSDIRNAVIEQVLTVYHQMKKVDFDIAILNWEGILYREYRMMLPINSTEGSVSYEVPYGVVTVGKDELPGAAGERYYVENSKQHPRGINNWIHVSDKDFGVTVSSSVAVADYIDPTTNPSQNFVIQPILLASRKSCHGEGNEYLQYGDHSYHFSLTSHPTGWKNGYRFGQASNEMLQAVFSPKTYKDASLPASMSFFDIQNDHIVVSAIKKCEDDESIIIRLYNLGDQAETIRLSTDYIPKKIIRTNLIEEELETVNEMTLGKYAIETYKLTY